MIVGFRVFRPVAPSDLTPPELARLEHNIPPDLVIVAATDTKVFHVSGCDLIRNKDKDKLKTMTAKDAMREGYVPCARCLRKYLTAQARREIDSDTDRHADADDPPHGAGQ